MRPLTLHPESVTSRPFMGLGVEADPYIFDEANRRCGVNEQDFEIIENRVRGLRPSIARIFANVPWFSHLAEGDPLPTEEYLALGRQLRLLKATQTAVNLVLFQPDAWQEKDLEAAVRAMIEALAHLHVAEGFSHIRWLTLWNEPDHSFSHNSPLSQRLFGDHPAAPSDWTEYVRLNRLAYELLQEKLPEVKLVVADTVWGPMMRRERMELALEAFGDLNVAYSFHTYSSESEIRNHANLDYFYHGIETEVAEFRRLLGPDRELGCWEFNTSGVTGFGTFFAGVGPQGEDRISSIKGAVELSEKVLAGMAGGVELFSLWCLHDMIYGGLNNPRLMEFGLWRFKQQHWYPRPIYHYYSALVAAFRPGVYLHRVAHAVPDLKAIAAKSEGGTLLAVLNAGESETTLSIPLSADARVLRIDPARLPAVAETPLHLKTPQSCPSNAALVVAPGELVFAFDESYSGFPVQPD